MPEVKTTVAKASGNAGSSSGGSLSPSSIESAMAEAAAALHAKGVWDDDEIREAKLAARERVKREHREEQERLAAEQRARDEEEAKG